MILELHTDLEYDHADQIPNTPAIDTPSLLHIEKHNKQWKEIQLESS